MISLLSDRFPHLLIGIKVAKSGPNGEHEKCGILFKEAFQDENLRIILQNRSVPCYTPTLPL